MNVCGDGTDNSVSTLAKQAGFKCPVISGSSGGSTICGKYPHSATPTIILINPLKKVVEKDIWPATNLPTTLAKYPINTTALLNTDKGMLATNDKVKVLAVSKHGIFLDVKSAGMYSIKIVDVQGRVNCAFSGNLTAGNNEIGWNGNALSHKVLFVEISRDGFSRVTVLNGGF